MQVNHKPVNQPSPQLKPVNAQQVVKSVVIYLGSSNDVDKLYFDAAKELATVLVKHDIQIVFGGSGCGLMKTLADTALAQGGKVVGIIPKIFKSQMTNLTESIQVDNMHERKKMMMARSDACVALPGGLGTLEELLEAITWLKLGINPKPVVIVNIQGYYDPLIEMLEKMIKQKFCPRRYWLVVDKVQDVPKVIQEWYASTKQYQTPEITE